MPALLTRISIAAQDVGDFAGQFGDFVRIADVVCKVFGPPAHIANLAADILGKFAAREAGQADVGAARRQRQGNRLADAARAARHQGRFAFQAKVRNMNPLFDVE